MCQDGITTIPTLATPPTLSTRARLTRNLPTGTIADRLEYARISSGLSYAALAKAAGTHRETIHASMQHPLRMRSDRFFAVCLATGADPAWILYAESPPPPAPLSGHTIGDRLADLRQQLGHGVRHMSTLCGCGSTTTYSQWSNGQNIPTLDSLMRVAHTFGISAASFSPE